MTSRGLLLLAAVGLLPLGPAPARAERRLHERVPDPRRGEGPMLDQPAEGRTPAALRVAGREIPEPAHDATLGVGERPFERGAPGDGALGRLERWRPDLLTDAFPEHLLYTETFQPSVAPHKRGSALDEVGPGYELRVRDERLREVPVGGSAAADRDLFWGSVAVRLVPGRAVPIPSAGPDSRILAVRTVPERPVRFLVDGADNLYVVGAAEGLTRIVFVTDTPAAYFGGSLPERVDAGSVPPAMRPSLPPEVARTAREVARGLGLDAAAPMARNLPRLVAHLRSFSPEPLDGAPGADPLVTLATARRGVCRHRAFVFVVLAHALGIPARFVVNEAHAFTEVFVPTVGWRRIDLGGAGPLAEAGAGVVRHEPRERDPFPWPRGRQPPAGGRGSAEGGARGDEGTSRAVAGATGPATEAGARPGETGDATRVRDGGLGVATGDGPGDGPGDGGPGEPTEPGPAGRVVLESYSPNVVRGEALTVSGRLEGTGQDWSRARVAVWLTGRAGGTPIRIGTVRVDATGGFAAALVVPSDLPAGDYAVSANLAEP